MLLLGLVNRAAMQITKQYHFEYLLERNNNCKYLKVHNEDAAEI